MIGSKSRSNRAPARRRRGAPRKTFGKMGQVAAGTVTVGAGIFRPGPLLPVARASSALSDLILEALTTPRVASLAILAVCLASLVYFSYDTRFYVTRVQVEGNQWVDSVDVVKASALENTHVAWIQTDQAEQLIGKRLPTVRDADVHCALPAGCTIAIQERQPLFVWRQGQAWAWVDAEGILFTAQGNISHTLVVDMPPGKLPLPGTRIDRDVLSGVQALTRLAPDLRWMRYSVERGFEFLDPAGGWPVYLGAYEGIETRLAVWRALSNHLASQGLWPAYIDVRYALAPYYALLPARQ